MIAISLKFSWNISLLILQKPLPAFHIYFFLILVNSWKIIRVREEEDTTPIFFPKSLILDIDEMNYWSMSWILTMNSRQGKKLPSYLTLCLSQKKFLLPGNPANPSPAISRLAISFISHNKCHFLREDVSDPPIL